MLKNKSQAEEELIKHIEQLNASNKRVSRIRTDKGGEFILTNFRHYCEKKGIKQEYTVGYTPQQCGVAERLNRTLLDKVRSMFVDTNLPKSLWAEAVRCAVYQLNRSPTRALYGKIPAEIFLGKTNLSKMRVFGSKAWAYKLPKENKLEPRATKVRMIGYAGAGYRVWNPTSNEVFVSRDVTFNESDYKYNEVGGNSNESKNDTPQVIEETADQEKQKEKSSEEENIRIENKTQKGADESKRTVKKPQKYEDYELYTAYCLMTETEDPKFYQEAITSSEEWCNAINKEIDAHEKFGTWEVTNPPDDKKILETKWVFRTKVDGTKKARLVAKGYQEEGTNVYAPVAKMPTVRMFLCHALQNNYGIGQLDIPNAFLNDTLNIEVYIKVPEGVKVKGEKVLKLKKALYGLKEAPRVWNECFNDFATRNGLQRSKNDTCLYIGENIWLVVWVDDILITGSENAKEEIIKKLRKEFNAKNLGRIKCFLGTEIIREEDTIKLSQKKLIDKIVQRFNMSECKAAVNPMEFNFQINKSEEIIAVPYRELIRSLTYLSMISRPDITFATSYLGRYLDHPTTAAWKAAKRIIRYVKATRNLSLTFRKTTGLGITAFSDADWAADKNDRKSVSGMAIYYGANLVSWSSKKQPTIALSTAEAEYVAAASSVVELIYLKGLVFDFTGSEMNSVLLVDNQSAISMINTNENSKRTKHIDIKVHFIRDIVAKQLIKVNYVSSECNTADMLTKPLCSVKFNRFRNELCLT